jgi:biofilm protein TabA
MILDTLDNAGLYYSLSPRIARALKFLSEARTSRLEPPLPAADAALRHPIDGDDNFAVIQRYRARAPRKAFFEAHRRYIDVQYVVEGIEAIAVCNIKGMRKVAAYDAERDFIKLAPRKQLPCSINVPAGHFAIFFPHDAHMPALAIKGMPSGVKKIVVKVRAYKHTSIQA